MLVLVRYPNQGVRIFDADGRYVARIVVLEPKQSGRVELGIDCDPRFLVLRDELVADAAKEAS